MLSNCRGFSTQVMFIKHRNQKLDPEVRVFGYGAAGEECSVLVGNDMITFTEGSRVIEYPSTNIEELLTNLKKYVSFSIVRLMFQVVVNGKTYQLTKPIGVGNSEACASGFAELFRKVIT